MSAIDLQTLRATVRFEGDYPQSNKFPNADVNKVIQRAFTEFYELVADTYQGYWDVAGNVSTASGVAFVAAPADTWRVQAIDRLDGTDFIELMQVGLDERNRFGSSTGVPIAYRLSARGIELHPTPNAVYTLRVSYTPIAPALVEATAREWFNGWEDYVVQATLLRLDGREQRPIGERQSMVDRARARIISGAQRRRSQEPQYIPLRERNGRAGFFTGEMD